MEEQNTQKGDIVIRDKINTQVNAEGDYFENVIVTFNDLDSIIKSVEEWWHTTSERELLILFICETIDIIRASPELAPIESYYGINTCDWKPFNNETISELILEFKKNTGFKVKGYVYNCSAIDDINFAIKFEDIYLPKIIIVSDGLGLSANISSFSSSIDYIREIGGLLIPLDEDIDKETRGYIKSRWNMTFKRMYCRVNESFGNPYPNISIGTNRDKRVFFKTLTDFANALEIKSPHLKAVFSVFAKGPIGLESLTNDGN